MAATIEVNQEAPALSPLAESLGIDNDDLDLLEDFFVEATAAKNLSGDKIFAKLKRGGSFGQALGISNDTIEFLYARAHRWVAIGRHEKAEPIFRTLCVIDGTSADYWIGLGICLRARSAWNEALAAFRVASEKRPAWDIPHFHALELCLHRKDWAQAAIELAAFEEKANNETDVAIKAEVGKYKKVLQLRGRAIKQGASEP